MKPASQDRRGANIDAVKDDHRRPHEQPREHDVAQKVRPLGHTNAAGGEARGRADDDQWCRPLVAMAATA